MAMGMSYKEFWEDRPELVIAYRKADEIRRRRMNEELWLAGIYTMEALASTVGNMFSKSQKHEYPHEPKPITASEIEERRQREEKARMERMKAAFMARALKINASMGVEVNDH